MSLPEKAGFADGFRRRRFDPGWAYVERESELYEVSYTIGGVVRAAAEIVALAAVFVVGWWMGLDAPIVP